MKHLQRVFDALLSEYGPQQWWPAKDAFEVVAGAILVQRTAWQNAEAAVENLSSAELLTPSRVAAAPISRLEELIRPAGFFRVKAARLKHVSAGIERVGGIDMLQRLDTSELRAYLLGLHGIGAETADTILVYAFERPAVIVDAYMRRLVRRLDARAPRSVAMLDESIRRSGSATLVTTRDLNELHALVVEHGKRICRERPLCSVCAVRRWCDYGCVAVAGNQSEVQTNPSSRR
jgi:endonuclease-3 related protein